MDRRKVLKLGTAASVAAVAGITTQTTGCTSPQVENLVNTILQSIANLLAAAGQTAWSKELEKAEQGLTTAEQTWKGGGAVAILIDALNTVEAVAAVIPVTEPFSPFIDVIVAAVESVLALFPTATVTAHAALKPNPHKGRIGNFKSARAAAEEWNDATLALPALKVARLKVPL